MAGTSESGKQPAPEPKHCHWCSAPAAEGATHCSACGASLAERETLDGIAIPGLTVVDPGLIEDEGGPLTKLAQARTRLDWEAPPAAIGSPVSVEAYVLEKVLDKAQELLAGPEAEEVGEIPEAALSVADRLDEEAQEDGAAAEAASVEAAPPAPEEASAETPTPVQDPWSDLPPPEYDPWAEPAPDPWAGAQTDPWANQADPWANQADPWAIKQDPWATSPYDPFSVEGGPWTRDLWEQAPPDKGPDDSPGSDNDGPESGSSDESRR